MTWEAFYQEHYRVVYGYLLALCGDSDTAEELTAETFLRAVERYRDYDGRGGPAAWLCRVAKNLFVDERRRQRRQTRLEDAPEGRTPPLEETVSRRETAASVRRAAEALPPERRQVFWMRLEGLSFREIGAALGRGENWARVTYFRAKNKVLERVEEEDGS